ncbi:MAG TPA: winged helix-turn-helix transcriptional regulator [Nitrososphaera sp.]|nr:winged helix-turn-helix transcriptional regulator [Nitrososphaera sp.]
MLAARLVQSGTRSSGRLSMGLAARYLLTGYTSLKKRYIVERRSYNEIPPRVEYQLTAKGQELVESIINLLQWMRKWSTVATD